LRSGALSLPATLTWSAAATLVICALALAAGPGQGWYGQPGFLLVHFVYLQILLHGIAAMIVLVAIQRAGRAPLEFLAVSRPTWGDVYRGIVWGFGTFVALTIAAAFLVSILWNVFGVTTDLFASITSWTSAAAGMGSLGKFAFAVCLAFWTVVAAPVSEEMVYRGLLYQGVAESRIGAIGAILVSALAFGFMHKLFGYGWVDVAATSAVGLVLGFLRWHTGSLTFPIMTHAIYNCPSALAETIEILAA
jgi:membrane protease YdiL (CAAX protease family)